MPEASPVPAPSGRWATRGGLLALYLSWGSTYPVMRIALRDLPPFLLLTGRCLIAAVPLLLLARARGVPWPDRREWRGSLLVGGLVLGAGHGLTAWGLLHAGGGLAALLVSTVSVWMALLSWLLLGRRPSRQAMAGLVVGLLGLVALAGSAGGSLATGAIVALLLSPVAQALGAVASLRAPLPADPLMATAAQLCVVAPGFVLLSLVNGEPGGLTAAAWSSGSIAALLYLAIGGYVVGFTAYTWLVRVLPLPTVGTYAYANPVVAVVLGATLLGEPLTRHLVVGGLVTLAGVALVVLDRTPVPRVLRLPSPVSDRAAEYTTG